MAKIKPTKKRAGNDLEPVSDGVREIFRIFYETINPQINFGNKTTRQAAQWLIDKYGLQKVVNMSEYACSVQSEPYAPTITTPYQLKEKLAALIKFKLGQDAKKNNQPKIWRKDTSQSQWQEPTTRLLRKPPTESSLPTTRT